VKTSGKTIDFEIFAAVDIRVGTVVRAELLEGARKPAIKLEIDFGGELGKKWSSAQLTVHYTPEVLVGKRVCAVVNFAPKRIAGFESQVLVLGFADAAGAVVLIAPDHAVANGARLY
jgi:tRNA-binding protein